MRPLFQTISYLVVAGLSLVTASLVRSCDDPLVCYLNSLDIELPDTCIPLSNGKDLCISDFHCDGVQISSIPSAYVPPSSLSLGIHGLGTECSAKTKYGILPGKVTVSISQTDLDATVRIQKKDEYPIATWLPQCNVSSIVISIDFGDPLLDIFAGEISKVIENLIYKATCVGLQKLLVTNVTQFIDHKLNPALSKIIMSPASPYPVYSDRYVDWNNSIVSKAHHAVDKIRGLSNLPDFLSCMIKAHSADVLYEIVRDVVSLVPGNFNLPKTVPVLSAGDMALSVTGVSLGGLDTVNDLEILEPLGVQSKVTMRSALRFDYMHLNITMHLKVTKDIDGQTATYDEDIMLTLEIEDLNAVVDLVVAVDDHFLESLYLDQLGALGCWTASLTELSIPNFDVQLNPAQLRISQISGSAGPLEKDIVSLLDNVFLLLLSPKGFNQLTQEVLRGAIQGPLRTSVNEKLATFLLELRGEQPCLTHYPYDDEVQLIDWRLSKVVNTINGLVNEYIGPQGVNQLLSCATNGTGALAFDTKFISIAIGGLNSFYALQLLAPPPSESMLYRLQNLVGLGFCESKDSAACSPLTVTISSSREVVDMIARSISVSLARTVSSFKLSLSVSNLAIFLDSFLAVDFNSFRDLQRPQLGTTGCVASTMQNASLQNLSLSLSSAEMSIQSTTGGISAHRNITLGVSKFFNFLTRPQKIDAHNAQTMAQLNDAGPTCSNGGVNPNIHTDTIDTDSSGGSHGILGGLDWQWELFILCVGCTLCLAGLLMAYSYWGTAHKRGSRGNACGLDMRYGVAVLEDDEEEERERKEREKKLMSLTYHDDNASVKSTWWDKYRCSEGLLFHPEVPVWIRYSIPLVILGNIYLFIQSNMSADAVSVMVSITTGTTVHDVGSVFDFGLGGTVSDMWSAKVYPLAILIAFFSGAWPYVKLMVMLSAWTLPPALLSLERREYFLVLLDALGKWSLVDFFVMVLMLCAFYFELVVYPDVMVVDVTVRPGWGFYSFLLATMVSLGLGHTILACHRLVSEPKVLPLPDEYDPRESLCTAHYELNVVDVDKQEELELLLAIAHEMDDEDDQQEDDEVDSMPQNVLGVGALSLTTPEHNNTLRRRTNQQQQSSSSPRPTRTRRTTSRSSSLSSASQAKAKHAKKPFPQATQQLVVRITTAGRTTIAVVLLASIFCVIAGCFLKTMGFEFKGLTGYMLHDAAFVDYSFVSVGNVLPKHSGVPNDFAIRWLQASYFLFGIAMPLAFLLSLVVLWLVPLTLRRQRQMHVLSEVLNAWSTLDVFCVSIVAALLEIQQFAAFIVGDSCDGINVALEKEMIDAKLDGDDKCFDVVAYLKSTSWVLFLAAAMLLALSIPSLAACHATIHRRLHASNAIAHKHMTSMQSLQLSEEGQSKAHETSNYSNSERTSDLHTPLLLVDDGSVKNTPLHTVANSNGNNIDNSHIKTNREDEEEQELLQRMVNGPRNSRQERKLDTLYRHRQRHQVARLLRKVCSWQFVGLSMLRGLEWCRLLTINAVESDEIVQQEQTQEASEEMDEVAQNLFDSDRADSCVKVCIGEGESEAEEEDEANVSYSAIYNSPAPVLGENNIHNNSIFKAPQQQQTQEPHMLPQDLSPSLLC